MSNFTKILASALLMLFFSSKLLFAAGVPFQVSGQVAEDGKYSTEELLKQQAVADWLKGKMGAGFEQVQAEVTPEFAESYIMDYGVKRNSSNTSLQLTGHLDGNALMRWMRLKQTTNPGGSSQLKPFLVVSSIVPGLALSSRETRRRTMDVIFARALSKMSSDTLNKFNIRMFPAPDTRLPLLSPPDTGSELRDLGKYARQNNFNSALWLHLVPCQPCGGIKLNTTFYNLNQGRAIIVRSDNVRIAPPQYQNLSAVQASLGSAFSALESDIKEMISSGSASSRIYRVQIQSIPSYRAFRVLSQQLSEVDFLSKAVTSSIVPGGAEFEVLSALGAQDLAQRLKITNFNSFELQPVRVDSNTVVVRYLGSGG